MIGPRPLPGIDEAYLAAAGQGAPALVRWLVERSGLTPAAAAAEVAALDDDTRAGMDLEAEGHLSDHDDCDCCFEIGCDEEPAGRPMLTIEHNGRYL